MMSRMAWNRGRRRLDRKTQTIIGVGLAVVTVAAVGGGLAYDSARTSDSAAGYESTYTVPPQPVYEYVPVSILGDSYSYGVGADTNKGYAKQLASRLCWRTNFNTEPGTGYVNNGGEEGKAAYPTRAEGAALGEPDLIIVQGSTNDNATAGPQITAAATDTFRLLRGAAPEATIVAVGPTLVPSIDPAALLADRDAVRAAADANGVPFIDPIELGWLADATLYGEDGLHPTQAGHDELYASLRGELEKMNLPRLSGCDPV